jgi:hypothetical protein
MMDDVPKQRVEGMSVRTPTFSTEQAANFAKMRENAFKRNRALLKVRSVTKSTESERLRCLLVDISLQC